jgi:hypothetical protein
VQIKFTLVERRLRKMARQIGNVATTLADEFQDQLGDVPVIDKVTRLIGQRAKSVLLALDAGAGTRA